MGLGSVSISCIELLKLINTGHMKRLLLLLLILFIAPGLRAQDNNKPLTPSVKVVKDKSSIPVQGKGDTAVRFDTHRDSVHVKNTTDENRIQFVTKKDTSHWQPKYKPTLCYFSFTTDAMQYLLHQPNVGVEYRTENFAYGLNIGLVFPDNAFAVNPFANAQYTWPGLVYYGEALRAYWKFFYNENMPANYFSVQLEYKYLWYNNVGFTDYEPSTSININYSMNETANALGFDVLHGHEWQLLDIIHLEVFYGLGLHIKVRDYTVLPSAFSSNPINTQFPPLVGSYKDAISYPAPILGFRVGFNLLNKKAANNQPAPVNSDYLRK